MTRHRAEVPAVGFISPPRWISPSITEFPASVRQPVIPQQCIPDLPGFDYALGSVAAAHPTVCRAAALLGEMGCAAIAMEGTPFAWAGAGSEDAARARVDEMTAAAGVPAFSAGTAIIDALRALDARRVALCPTYYPEDWRDAWGAFVSSAGIGVAYNQTMADQGIVGPITDNDDYGWRTGPDLLRKTVAAAARTPCDVIVVTGAGCRVNRIVTELEAIARRPVIGSDTAIFRALARSAGLTLNTGALGALTEI